MAINLDSDDEVRHVLAGRGRDVAMRYVGLIEAGEPVALDAALGITKRSRSRARAPPSRSCTLAAVTITSSSSPAVSTTT